MAHDNVTGVNTANVTAWLRDRVDVEGILDFDLVASVKSARERVFFTNFDLVKRSEDGAKPFPFQEFSLGSTVLLIPNHSCLAAFPTQTFRPTPEVRRPLEPDKISEA